MELFALPDQIKGQIAMDTDPQGITPEMLRDAYTTLHLLQGRLDLAPSYAAGLSSARIICALLYPAVIGCRPGEDEETMRRIAP